MPDDAIGASGTPVRCTACGTEWFVEPKITGEAATPDALELRDLEEAERGETERVDAPAPVGAVDMITEEEASFVRPNAATPNPATLMRQKRSAEARRSRLRAILAVWLMALAVVAAMAVAAILLRHAIVERHPGASGLFSALGLPTTATGLDLSPVEMRLAEVDGTDFLVVSGTVRNLTSTSRAVPLVELALVGPGGAELARWSVDAGAPLEGGERREWTSEYPNPSVDAQTLRVRFETGTGAMDVPL